MKYKHSVFWLKALFAILMTWGNSQAYATVHCNWAPSFQVDSVSDGSVIGVNSITVKPGSIVKGRLIYTLVREVWLNSGDACFLAYRHMLPKVAIAGFDWTFGDSSSLSNFILPSTCLRSANTSGFRQQVLTLDGQNYNYLDEVWAYNAALPRCENFVRTIPFTAERKSGPFLNLIDAASFVGVAGGNSSNNSISVVAWCDRSPIDCSKRYMTVSQSVSTCKVDTPPDVIRLPNVTPFFKNYTVKVPFSIKVTCPPSEGQAKSMALKFNYSPDEFASYVTRNNGTAINVGIKINNENSGPFQGSTIQNDSISSFSWVPLSDTASTEKIFNYSAEYHQPNPYIPVLPGTVSSTATVTLMFQ